MIPGIGREVMEGSVRACDGCGKYVPFDNPDAELRLCHECCLEAGA